MSDGRRRAASAASADVHEVLPERHAARMPTMWTRHEYPVTETRASAASGRFGRGSNPVVGGGHNCAVITIEDLVEAVDQQFAERSPELVVWPGPHDGGPPVDGEYPRATRPERWRILGARVDAWVAALVDAGLASVEQVAVDDIRWEEPPGTRMSSAVRVVPSSRGARPLVVVQSQIGDVPATGITLGWGDPAVLVGLFPHCGCDACDGGAQPELDVVDDRLSSIVSGG